MLPTRSSTGTTTTKRSAAATWLAYLALLLSASAPDSASATFWGRATTYGTNDFSGGACSVRQAPNNVNPTYFVAMNKEQYGNSCGRCVSITGPRGTFTAFASDLCSECGQNNLDFSGNLWNAVTGKTPGIEPISWDFVPCPNPSPAICLKEGSNTWWVAVQAANVRDGVSSIEIAGSKGAMIGTTAFYFVNTNGNVDLNRLPVTVVSVGGARESYTVALKENQCTTVSSPPPSPGACKLQDGADFIGNDIGSVLSSKAEPCCDICRSTAGCRAFTWSVYNGGTCWLKSAKGQVNTGIAGVTSAEI